MHYTLGRIARRWLLFFSSKSTLISDLIFFKIEKRDVTICGMDVKKIDSKRG